MRTLKEAKPGESVSVVKVHGAGALRRRLLRREAASTY